MSAIKTVVDIPKAAAAEMTTVEEIYSALGDFASAIAQAMGLVIRSDLTVTEPSYAPYAKVFFLAADASSNPLFTVYNISSNTFNQRIIFIFEIAKEMSGVWSPFSVVAYDNIGGGLRPLLASNGMARDGMLFEFPVSKFKMQKLVFDDGRILFTFMNTNVDGSLATMPSVCSILKTDIYHVTEGKINTYVMLGASLRTSWISALETNLGVNDETYANFDYRDMSKSLYMYPANGREFMMGKTIWLDANSYIDNVYVFSNRGLAVDGKGVSINGDKYYVARVRNTTTYTALIIPEEV